MKNLQVIMTKGLPASGKSTWCKEFIESERKQNRVWKRINKDDLRKMMDDSHFSKSNEQFILATRDTLISSNLIVGNNVIVDDTNLNKKHEIRIEEIIRDFTIVFKIPVDFEIKDFTDVPVEECIKRDQLRTNPVGEKVIMNMWRQYLAPKPKIIEHDDNLADCIICDIDGTLAIHNGRTAFEFSKLSTDLLNEPIADILGRFYTNSMIIFVTGREEKYRDVTCNWLVKNKVLPFCQLFMRPTGDMRPDQEIKLEIYKKEIEGKYNVRFVLDDRDRVVDMWRQQGLTCLQVNYGNF